MDIFHSFNNANGAAHVNRWINLRQAAYMIEWPIDDKRQVRTKPLSTHKVLCIRPNRLMTDHHCLCIASSSRGIKNICYIMWSRLLRQQAGIFIILLRRNILM